SNPEGSSVRDSERVLGLLSSLTKRAESEGSAAVKAQVLLTRRGSSRSNSGEMMTVWDVLDIVVVPLLVIIPESRAVLRASNVGTPVILDGPSNAATAYDDAVARLIGEDVEMRVLRDRGPSLFQRLLGRTA